MSPRTPATRRHQSPERIAILEALRADFASARRTGGGYRQVPTPLRLAVLSALRNGVSLTAIKNACGLTSKQIERWRALCAPSALPVAASSTKAARVLRVVDGEAGSCGSAAAEATTDVALEIRVGSLRISVQVV